MHCAGESSPGNLPPKTHAVVLSADNEDDVLKAHKRLSMRAIPHVVIYEPDAPFNGEAAGIGVYPVKNRKPVQKALRGFHLLKGLKTDES